jgi:hypothetical protein
MERYGRPNYNTFFTSAISGLGQSLPKWAARAMSVMPPLATELQTSPEVRFVPTTDSCAAANQTSLFDHLVGAQQ